MSPPTTKMLRIDDKFSIMYDPNDNDRPTHVFRYGEVHSQFDFFTPNYVTAMFYALLEKQNDENDRNQAPD